MSSLIAGLTIGGATGMAFMLAEVITGASQIDLKSAVGVGVFTCGIIWWMGRKFQSLEDNQKEMKTDIDAIKTRLGSKSNKP